MWRIDQWDIETGQRVWQWSDSKGSLGDFELSPDSTMAAASWPPWPTPRQTCSTGIWDLSTGKELVRLEDANLPKFLADGKTLVGVNRDNQVVVFEVGRWNRLKSLTIPDLSRNRKALARPLSDGTLLIETTHRAGKPTNSFFRWIERAATTLGIMSVPLSSAGPTTQLEVWDVTGEHRQATINSGADPSSWQLSDDGRTLVVARNDPPRGIFIEVFNLPPELPVAWILFWSFASAAAMLLIWRLSRRTSPLYG